MHGYEKLSDTMMPSAELRDELGISESTERRLRQRKDWLPHVHIGREIFYLRAAIKSWLDSQISGGDISQGGAGTTYCSDCHRDELSLESPHQAAITHGEK